MKAKHAKQETIKTILKYIRNIKKTVPAKIEKKVQYVQLKKYFVYHPHNNQMVAPEVTTLTIYD